MKILVSPAFWLTTIFLASVYLIFTTYLVNYRLVRETVFGPYPAGYKFNLLLSLVGGLATAIPRLNAVALTVIALLTGANLTLLIKNLLARRRPGVYCVATGSSIFSSLAGICSACSLPLLTILGLGGSFLWLPLGGTALSFLVIILLAVSLYFSLQPVMLDVGGEVRLNEK